MLKQTFSVVSEAGGKIWSLHISILFESHQLIHLVCFSYSFLQMILAELQNYTLETPAEKQKNSI